MYIIRKRYNYIIGFYNNFIHNCKINIRDQYILLNNHSNFLLLHNLQGNFHNTIYFHILYYQANILHLNIKLYYS